MTEPKPTVTVTKIGEYIRYRSCERRFKLGFNNRQLAKEPPFAERLFNLLDPVLQEHGRQRERAWEASLKESGLTTIAQQGGENNTATDHQSEGDAAPEVETITWDDLYRAVNLYKHGSSCLRSRGRGCRGARSLPSSGTHRLRAGSMGCR